MALSVHSISAKEQRDFLHSLALNLGPRLDRIENTTIIMNTVILLILLLILTFTLVGCLQIVLTAKQKDSQRESGLTATHTTYKLVTPLEDADRR